MTRHAWRRTAPAALALAATMLLVPASALGQSFADALLAARSADPQYRAKLAEVQVRRIQSREAGASFLPSANLSYAQTEAGTGAKGSYTASLSQPLLDYNRYLQLQQRDPLATQAAAEAVLADNDLALRVFKAMAELVRTRETIRALDVQIDGLQSQYKRAQRMRELGQGTVTEVSDFEVRVAVAQANRLSQLNALDAAQRAFSVLTGVRPVVASLQLTVGMAPDARALPLLEAQVRRSDASVVLATQAVVLARIGGKRTWAQYLPTVAATASRSHTSAGGTSNAARVGLVINAPLGAGNYYEQQKATVDIERALENQRAAEEAAVTELRNVHAAVQSLTRELAIRERAVEAAQQAVDGNVKSYQGGVKSNIDVMTSYQNLADAELGLVNVRISLEEARLRLGLLLHAVSTDP